MWEETFSERKKTVCWEAGEGMSFLFFCRWAFHLESSLSVSLGIPHVWGGVCYSSLCSSVVRKRENKKACITVLTHDP